MLFCKIFTGVGEVKLFVICFTTEKYFYLSLVGVGPIFGICQYPFIWKIIVICLIFIFRLFSFYPFNFPLVGMLLVVECDKLWGFIRQIDLTGDLGAAVHPGLGLALLQQVSPGINLVFIIKLNILSVMWCRQFSLLYYIILLLYYIIFIYLSERLSSTNNYNVVGNIWKFASYTAPTDIS